MKKSSSSPNYMKSTISFEVKKYKPILKNKIKKSRSGIPQLVSPPPSPPNYILKNRIKKSRSGIPPLPSLPPSPLNYICYYNVLFDFDSLGESYNEDESLDEFKVDKSINELSGNDLLEEEDEVQRIDLDHLKPPNYICYNNVLFDFDSLGESYNEESEERYTVEQSEVINMEMEKEIINLDVSLEEFNVDKSINEVSGNDQLEEEDEVQRVDLDHWKPPNYICYNNVLFDFDSLGESYNEESKEIHVADHSEALDMEMERESINLDEEEFNVDKSINGVSGNDQLEEEDEVYSLLSSSRTIGQMEIQRREEKEAAEVLKRDLKLCEAKRQQQRLNFLLSQTVLYSHLLLNKPTIPASEALDKADDQLNKQEMGPGKTIQAMDFFAHLAEEKNIWAPFLVVAPALVLNKWTDKFSRFFPNLKNLPNWGGLPERVILRKKYEPKASLPK